MMNHGLTIAANRDEELGISFVKTYQSTREGALALITLSVGGVIFVRVHSRALTRRRGMITNKHNRNRYEF